MSNLVTWVWTGSAFVVPSAMATTAIHAMTMSLAAEWGPHNIRLNAPAPGPFPTEGAWDKLNPISDTVSSATSTAKVPMRRFGRMPELTNLVTFLLSDACDYLTGQTIAIDGGQHLAGPGTFADLQPDRRTMAGRPRSYRRLGRQGKIRTDDQRRRKRGLRIERKLFGPEHEMWRDSVRRFVAKEIVPFHDQWEKDGIVPRELWLKAGEAGMLCCTVPEEYGGLGLDYLFDAIVYEELWRVGASGPGFLIHTDLVTTYILTAGTEEQKREWLPRMVKGEAIGSLGMTEPHAGSDLKAIRTRAERDGNEHFLINGQKVFISNGQMCDILVLATKTDSSAGAKGVTLFLVDTSLPGFKRGKNLEKLGMKAQDASELFFDNLRIAASAMLAAEGEGFKLMMTKLPQERLAQAVRSATVTETINAMTVEYTAERRAFDKSIADFQNTQFVLADLKARSVMARVFTDKCIELFMAGELDPVDAARAKLVTSELHCETADRCLQLFGGWGYMWEYPIARAYADARIVKIAGGSIEVMKTIISREIFKGRRGRGK